MILQVPDKAHLERWFAHKLAAAEQLRIIDMKRSFPGMSRETWFLKVEWREAGERVERRYVLRTQLPGGVSMSPQPLTYEARIFQILGGTDIPVPKLLWLETDAKWLIDGDRPFFVREMVPGLLEPANIRNPDARYNSDRIAMVKQLVEKLARIHSLDWRALGFGEFMKVPPSPADAARFELDHYLQDLRATRLQPFPVATEAMLALRETPPPPPQRIVLRKEKNVLGEEIWREDRIEIAAMSDWETASLGDPALDLAIALRTTGWAWNLEGMLDHYERCCGVRIDPASVRFYEVMWNVKMVVNLHAALAHFNTGRDRRIQLASLGLYAHIAEAALLRAAGF